ncbi:MAG: galactose-1-phosphate uridylyltransferase [Thermodesulfobacteriota bacterium]|nr:galactose-1-phosphate uridylyltransferase [Thermodesulfobacteriota bacterium]
MSEMRKDPVVERWVIITNDALRSPSISREKRIGEDGLDGTDKQRDALCPFCPGNERLCPPEILSNRPDGSSPNDPDWRLRVVPNRSPVMVVEGDLKRMGEGLYDKITGVGANEVIIETPKHGIRQSQMTCDDLENVFWAYRDRMIDLGKDSRLRYVLIYRNQGSAAGATLDHPYSVLMALPIVPAMVQSKIDGAQRHFEYKKRCIYCDILQEEMREQSRIVSESRFFLAIEPFAPRLPFETWIIPKRHISSYIHTEPGEIKDMACMFKEVVSRLDASLGRPAYNCILHSCPAGNTPPGLDQYYHWHMEILPRLTARGGFEWGSGFFINPTSPESAAAFLRGIVL